MLSKTTPELPCENATVDVPEVIVVVLISVNEPRLTENVYFQGTEGERIITEDGLDIINLEDASVPVHHVGYFVSERNTQIDGGIYSRIDRSKRELLGCL